ncbi:MAG: hypothetical protein NTX25_16905 [Proteobacteria bacterium]|nr:hypothetical protein [Pseudomonadota bacterium]
MFARLVLSFCLVAGLSACGTHEASEVKASITPGAVGPGKYTCLASNPASARRVSHISTGKTRAEACQAAAQLCEQLEGDNGPCVIDASYDQVLTGAGGVSSSGTKGYQCTVSERTANGRGRTFPGVGASVNDAYAAAKKLCELRGGIRCSMNAGCADLSNARIN